MGNYHSDRYAEKCPQRYAIGMIVAEGLELDDAWGSFSFHCIITLFAVRSFSPLPEDKSFGVTANNKIPPW